MSNLLVNCSDSPLMRTVQSKNSKKKIMVICNMPQNLKLCKTSLASSIKSATLFPSSYTRQFLISGSKLKRSAVPIPSSPGSQLKKPEAITKNQNNAIESQLSKPKTYEDLIKSFESSINAQDNQKKSLEALKNTPRNLEKSVTSLSKPQYTDIIDIKINYENIGSSPLMDNTDNDKFVPQLISKDLNPIEICQEIPSIPQQNNTLKSNQDFPQFLKLPFREIKPSSSTFKEITDVIHSNREIYKEKSASHNIQDFYELKGQYFRNYKYKKYDKDSLFQNCFGQNQKNKLPLVGSRWFPSIETIIEQSTHRTEIKDNTFEKLREDYILWKQNIIESRDKPSHMMIQSTENFKRNLLKTPNVVPIKTLQLQKIYKRKKPQTSECLLKTVLINKIKESDLKNEEHGEEKSIHMAIEGDRVNCGFKRNYSKKFNEIYYEFHKLLEKQRKLLSGLEIVGLKKNIEKGEKNKEIKKKIAWKAKQIDIESVSLETLKKHYTFLEKNHEKIVNRIMEIYEVDLDRGLQFNNFLKFYEVFIEKPLQIEKIVYFLMEFLKPKENTIRSFLKNWKLLLKNIPEVKKKKVIYQFYLDILSENDIIDKEQNSLDLSTLPSLFLANKLSPIDLFSIICKTPMS